MSIQSMTGFVSLQGALDGLDWAWEMRSVNGRGLDLRLRLPERFEGVEARLRKEVPKHFKRGNITIGLKLGQADSVGARFAAESYEQVIDALRALEMQAKKQGLDLRPASATDLLAARNLLENSNRSGPEETLLRAIEAEVPRLLEAFVTARQSEGAALAAVLSEQISRLGDLSRAAREVSEVRNAGQPAALRQRVAAVLEATDQVDEARLAQELALLAVKADVTEELDRLDAHVEAARALLGTGGPIGRKFDFLMQEFNREANTLCSKSGSTELTSIGLELKVVIDQMREQVQNVE